MARGQTLESILNLMRAEARLSLSPANNTQVRDSHIILLQREQVRLWEDFNWPHLRKHYLLPLQAGQYLYSPPGGTFDANADTYTVNIDRVERVSVRDGGAWVPLTPEITEANYAAHETALDERSSPARAWQATSNDEIEIWPIPDTNADADTLEGYARITGIRDLQPFAAAGDRADLDDRLIALYVAAGLLAASGAKDAQLKLEAANKLYTKLKGKQTKTTSFNMFGTVNRAPLRRKPVITRYVP